MTTTEGYPAPEYTQVPNMLLEDDLALMGLAELKVTLAIVRKIMGWHKEKPEPISLTLLQKMTGLSRQGVLDGVTQAIERGRVVQAGNGKRGVALYTLNFQENGLVKPVDQSMQETSTSQASRPELVKPVDTQKKLVKEMKENTIAPDGAAGGDAVLIPPPARKERKANPHFDLVAELAFGIEPGKPAGKETGGRVGKILNELKTSHGGTLPTVDVISAAHRIWRRENPRLTPPRDATKFDTMVREYEAKHRSGPPEPSTDPTAQQSLMGQFMQAVGHE